MSILHGSSHWTLPQWCGYLSYHSYCWSALSWGHTTSEWKTLGSTYAAVLPGPVLVHSTTLPSADKGTLDRPSVTLQITNYRITQVQGPNHMSLKDSLAPFKKKMGILSSLWGLCFVLIALRSTKNTLFWKCIFKFYANRPHNIVNIKTILTSLNFNSAKFQAFFSFLLKV